LASSSINEDVEGKSSEIMLEELAEDYSRFLNFDTTKEVMFIPKA
jgi:hypothetical protein